MAIEQIPKRDKVIELLAKNNYRAEYGAPVVDKDVYKDFFEVILKDNGAESSKMGLDPEEMVEKAMAKGSLDLGGNCKAVKCPESSNPAVCALAPSDRGGSNRMICSGPTEQKTKGGLIRSERKVYNKRLPYPDCAYMYSRAIYNSDPRDGSEEDYVETVTWVLKKLRSHPDYKVTDHFERFGVNGYSGLKEHLDGL